jgi:hypothetical protein
MNKIVPMDFNPSALRRYVVKYVAELDSRMAAAAERLAKDQPLELDPSERDEIRRLLQIGAEAMRQMYAQDCERLIEVAGDAS